MDDDVMNKMDLPCYATKWAYQDLEQQWWQHALAQLPGPDDVPTIEEVEVVSATVCQLDAEGEEDGEVKKKQKKDPQAKEERKVKPREAEQQKRDRTAGQGNSQGKYNKLAQEIHEDGKQCLEAHKFPAQDVEKKR